jgi:hypothetical protein
MLCDAHNHYVAEAAATRGAAMDKGCAWVATSETGPVFTRPAVKELKASTPATTRPIVVKTVTLAKAVG